MRDLLDCFLAISIRQWRIGNARGLSWHGTVFGAPIASYWALPSHQVKVQLEYCFIQTLVSLLYHCRDFPSAGSPCQPNPGIRLLSNKNAI